jgi:hypothetical protein
MLIYNQIITPTFN